MNNQNESLLNNNNLGLQEFELLNQINTMQSSSLLSILSSDQFPDILQNYSTDNCTLLLNLLLEFLNNPALINKKGPLGGYTALHWYTSLFYLNFYIHV
jgi:hypothetical protein